jgi:6-pyruvoyltetrahydropterin/6-carboxytetrahydropterin synthase
VPFSISKEVQLDMGHRVLRHHGHCANLHGHRYRVVAHAALTSGGVQQEGAATGMVVDFGVLKQALMYLHKLFDHRLCLEESDPLVGTLCLPETRTAFFAYLCPPLFSYHNLVRVYDTTRAGPLLVLPVTPTAENLAAVWWVLLTYRLAQAEPALLLERLDVWETPTSCAQFTPDDETRHWRLTRRLTGRVPTQSEEES